MPEHKAKVVVVGAGVTGLTSALLLLKAGYDVSVIGTHIPGDLNRFYTSPFAGAQWMSFAIHNEARIQDWDKPAYHEFLRLAKEEPTAGIHEVPLNYYVDRAHADAYHYPWFRYLVKDFQELTPENTRFPDKDLVKGFRFATVTVTTPHYLSFLYRKVLEHGGTVKRADIAHINDANKLHHSRAKPDLIVNATGLRARTLKGVEDRDVYPVKGQIIILTNSLSAQHVIEELPPSGKKEINGEVFYIFPRKEGGCIVGGLYLPVDNFGTTVDPKLTERILARAKKYVPELTDSTKFPGNKPELDVVTQYVAFRPGRKGGIRLEREGNIIHNYGAGGSGYQSSYGTAADVVKLADEYVAKKGASKL